MPWRCCEDLPKSIETEHATLALDSSRLDSYGSHRMSRALFARCVTRCGTPCEAKLSGIRYSYAEADENAKYSSVEPVSSLNQLDAISRWSTGYLRLHKSALSKPTWNSLIVSFIQPFQKALESRRWLANGHPLDSAQQTAAWHSTDPLRAPSQRIFLCFTLSGLQDRKAFPMRELLFCDSFYDRAKKRAFPSESARAKKKKKIKKLHERCADIDGDRLNGQIFATNNKVAGIIFVDQIRIFLTRKRHIDAIGTADGHWIRGHSISIFKCITVWSSCKPHCKTFAVKSSF